MKKVFILFLFLFSVGISFSQSTAKNADYKFAHLLENESYVKELPYLLAKVTQNADRYETTRSFDAIIVNHIVSEGIGENRLFHRHLRRYFGSTDPAVIEESKSYLLENL